MNKNILYIILGIILIPVYVYATPEDSLYIRTVGSCTMPGNIGHLDISGNYAFVADGDSGLVIIDISNPASPVRTARYDTPGYARDIIVSGNYAYIADSDSGLQIIDVSNPSSPTQVGHIPLIGTRFLDVSGNYAYVSCAFTGLHIIDISNPSAPIEVGSIAPTYMTLYGANSYNDVVVSGNYAYLIVRYSLPTSLNTRISYINVSNPAMPSATGGYNTTPNDALQMYVSGDYLYIAEEYDGLRIMNISNPSSPGTTSLFYIPGVAFSVTASGDYAYVTTVNQGMRVVDINDPYNPFLVGYYTTHANYGMNLAYGDYICMLDASDFRVCEMYNKSGSPVITASTPDSGAINVMIRDTITIAFSKPIETSSFTYTLLPNPGSLSLAWSKHYDTLRIIHAAFSYATVETVSITHAQDPFGNLLTGRNVITFTTITNQPPVITMKTQPASPQTVGRPYLVQAVIKDLVKKGDKSVAAESLYYRVNAGTWSVLSPGKVAGDTFSFLIPAIDSGLVEYYLQAWDNVGAATVEPPSGYYSFSVNTLPPVITYSTPDSGALNVAFTVPIMVVFSEPIDTLSFTYALLPDPGGVSRTWNKGRDTLRIAHAAFTYAVTETISVSYCQDLFGHLLNGRSVITFTTLSNQGPVITMKTQPASPQTVGRPYLVQAVIKDLVKKGDKSVAAESLYYRVNAGTWSVLSPGKVAGDTFSFLIPAIDSGLVEYYLQAWDNFYISIIEPPLDYYYFSVNTLPPAITFSTPDSGAVNLSLVVPIMIVFSEPLDTASFTFTVLPNPGDLGHIWNTGRDTLRIIHDPFAFGAVVTLSITHAVDPFGHLLTGRNVITFTILSEPAGDTRWDSRFGSAAGLGMNGLVADIVAYGSYLIVGGSFTTAGTVSANRIAKWSGNNWSVLGSGIDGSVTSLAVMGDSIYAGGSFFAAGGISANRVAKWDGANWVIMGSGMENSIYCLATSDNVLYAGGAFHTAGGISAYHIAKWDGVNWSALDSGMDTYVYALEVMGGNLYAGGAFITAGGVSAKYIAKWNGSSWSSLGSGMNGYVRALAFKGDTLYAAGEFTIAGGVSANRIAKWDGSSWSAVGNGVNARILGLAASGENLYAGGDFTVAGTDSAKYIAKWNGFTWSRLDNGTNGYVEEILAIDSTVYVGGVFTVAGGKDSRYFGIYHDTSETAPLAIELSSFTCQATINGVTLLWRTESETNNRAWLIERSEQAGGNYTRIAEMPAAGSTPTGQDYSYTDNSAKSGTNYYYKLGDQDLNGKVTWHGPIEAKTGEGNIYILALEACRPNPFNSNTTISYQLPKTSQVSLKVYNITGQEVKNLVEETQGQGTYHVSWNGRNGNGQAVKAGVYFYRLNAAGESIVKKAILIK